jgi:hypothetical protein
MKNYKELSATIEAKICESMDSEAIGIRRHEAIKIALKDWEDKKITERVVKKIAIHLPIGATVHLQKIGSLIQIVIWEKGYGKDMTTHLLAYDSNPFFKTGASDKQHSGFEYYDNRHGYAAIKRNEARSKFKNSDKIDDLAKAMLAKAELDEKVDSLLNNSECSYELKEIQETL